MGRGWCPVVSDFAAGDKRRVDARLLRIQPHHSAANFFAALVERQSAAVVIPLCMAVDDSVVTPIRLAQKLRFNVTEPHGSVFKESTR